MTNGNDKDQAAAAGDGAADTEATPQLTRRAHSRTIIAASGLPEPVQRTITEVVHRSRLWRREKADVAQELVAHFQDGLDGGATAKELLEAFGETARAAKLIRQAKKRNRPLIWRAWRRSAQGIALTLAIFFVFYIAIAVRFFSTSPVVSTDYLAKLNEAALNADPEDRAWPLYREGLLGLKQSEQLRDLTGTKPGEEQWETYAELLREHADDLATIRTAAKRPVFGYITGMQIAPEDQELYGDFGVDQWNDEPDEPYELGLIGVLLPHLADLRTASRHLLAEATLSAERGDGEAVLENYRAVLRVTEHIRQQWFLIDQLVAIAILASMAEHGFELLAAQPELFSDEQLRDWAHEVAARADRSQIQIDLTGEQYVFEDVVQRIYSDDGRGGGRLTATGARRLLKLSDLLMPGGWMKEDGGLVSHVNLEELAITVVGPGASLVVADRREILRKHREALAKVEQDFRTPLWKHRNLEEEIFVDLKGKSRRQQIAYAPLLLLMPAISRSGVNAELLLFRLESLQTAIALESYRRSHGNWPHDLSELTPALLPRIPTDRFNGEPLRYLVRDDEVVLYSVGANREDNGGTAALGRGGVVTDDAAARWIGPERLKQARETGHDSHVPEGDWILWRSRGRPDA